VTYVVGVDGAPDGWVAVRMLDSKIAGAANYGSFADLLKTQAEALVVAVDMPIGLPTAEAWPRTPDQAARDYIGLRRSSVFAVPIVEALNAPTHAKAVQRCVEAGTPKLSQQAYALRHKIFEVANFASDPRIHEVHPEVSFAALKGGHLDYGKRTWNGHRERMQILARANIGAPDDLGDLGRAGVDDVLDAIVAAWSASRIANGIAGYLPNDAPVGAPRIWY